MKERTEIQGRDAAPGPMKPVSQGSQGSQAAIDECRVRDEIEDDEVREVLGLPHQRRPRTREKKK